VAALEHYSICLASSNVTHNWQLAHGFSHRMTHTHTHKKLLSHWLHLTPDTCQRQVQACRS